MEVQAFSMGDAPLKNRQRFELVQQRYILSANKLVEEKVAFPKRVPIQKEDYIGYDYSPFKVLNILPLDDPSLSFYLGVWAFRQQ